MPRRPTNDAVVVLDRVSSRGKSGQTSFSRRKVTKVTDESNLSAAELSWMKNYAVVLKAVSYSYRYISDTIMVQTGIVKKWFEEPEVQEKVALVQADIVSGAVSHLKNQSIELTEMLLELARRTTDDAVKLRCIESGLDRVGVSKVNKSESVVTKTERQEVDFTSDVFERMEGLPLETQTKLAALATEMDELVQASKGQE